MFASTIAVRLAVASAAISVACIAPHQSVNTPSGRPEVDISGGTKAQIKDVIVGTMLQQGYDLKSSTDYTVSFEKLASGGQNVLLNMARMSSSYDGPAAYRITFTLVETQYAVKVGASESLVMNSGSKSESVSDITGGNAARGLQSFLLTVQSRVQSGHP